MNLNQIMPTRKQLIETGQKLQSEHGQQQPQQPPAPPPQQRPAPLPINDPPISAEAMEAFNGYSRAEWLPKLLTGAREGLCALSAPSWEGDLYREAMKTLLNLHCISEQILEEQDNTRAMDLLHIAKETEKNNLMLYISVIRSTERANGGTGQL